MMTNGDREGRIYNRMTFDLKVQVKNTYNLFVCLVTQTSTAGDWDCVAAVERLPALHYSVDFIFLSFGIMGLILEL